jgi:hypothetical protein
MRENLPISMKRKAKSPKKKPNNVSSSGSPGVLAVGEIVFWAGLLGLFFLSRCGST